MPANLENSALAQHWKRSGFILIPKKNNVKDCLNCHTIALLSQASELGEGNGNPLQYSCLENPMDGGVWWATVRGVAKYQTRLNDFTSQASKLMLNTLPARLQQDMNRELPDV